MGGLQRKLLQRDGNTHHDTPADRPVAAGAVDWKTRQCEKRVS